jgi:hypothetical protein
MAGMELKITGGPEPGEISIKLEAGVCLIINNDVSDKFLEVSDTITDTITERTTKIGAIGELGVTYGLWKSLFAEASVAYIYSTETRLIEEIESMKNRYLFILFAILLTINFLLFLPNCSTTDDNDFQLFELNVIIDEGVSGTPIQGTYSYNEGDTVDYSYGLLDNYKNLSVTLDNETIEPIGTVTITGVHTMRALADPIYDITGNWDLSEEYDDGSLFEVSTSFTGTLDNGTVTDTDGGEGVYAVDEYNRIEFNLEFDDINYEYEGLFPILNQPHR